MPTTCIIELDHPSRVIYSGNVLRGTVHLSLTNSKVIRSGSIRIVGKGHVSWTETVQRQVYDSRQKKSVTEQHTEVRSSNETYLDRTISFISDIGGVHLAPGTYRYLFENTLPINLPTSFNGSYGHISYKAKVVLDIKSHWFDKKHETPFTVIKNLDLNLSPSLREAVTANTIKTFFPCCLVCCWESGPLNIAARTPVGGYAPGQTINLNIIVSNKSDTAVLSFTAKLIKDITYHAGGYQKNNEVVVAERRTRGCNVNEEDNIHVDFDVPSVPPTELNASTIIKIRYYIRVKGYVEGMRKSPRLVIPIVIGTFPIRDVPRQQPIQTITPSDGVVVQQPNPSAPPMPAQTDSTKLPQPSAPTHFPDDEPPSYEEAMRFGELSDKEFTPRYPVFKRQTSYSNHV